MKIFKSSKFLFLLAAVWHQISLVNGSPVGSSVRNSDISVGSHGFNLSTTLDIASEQDGSNPSRRRRLENSDVGAPALVSARTSPSRPPWTPIANGVIPGAGDGRGEDAKSMETYASLGQRQLKFYDAAIKANKPDAIIVASKEMLAKHGKNEAFLDMELLETVQEPKHAGESKNAEKPNLEKAYKVEHQNFLVREDRMAKKILSFKSTDIGFQVDKSVRMNRVRIRTHGGAEINTAAIDPRGHFVVWEVAFKEKNNFPDAIPLNELGMQSFIKVAGANTKNLKVAFLSDIQNKEFWAITRQNYNDRKATFEQVLTFERGTPQFDRYIGSPNIGSKLFGLANHHNAISNREPSKIVIMPKQVKLEGVFPEPGEPPERVGQLWAALVFK